MWVSMRCKRRHVSESDVRFSTKKPTPTAALRQFDTSIKFLLVSKEVFAVVADTDDNF